jgi:dephospho-CoA kinase
MILGLTGSMGGGKSTAARLFEEEGYGRIDSDALVRDELLVLPEVIREIAGRFPDVIDGATRAVDRGLLARRVFADAEALAWLENLLHPRIYALWKERLATAPHGLWIIEVPLLFEKGLENWFDFTVCVATSSTNQIARLTERGIPQALAEQRISKQLPLAQKLERADFVLSNDGTPETLRMQVTRLAASLKNAR